MVRLTNLKNKMENMLVTSLNQRRQQLNDKMEGLISSVKGLSKKKQNNHENRPMSASIISLKQRKQQLNDKISKMFSSFKNLTKRIDRIKSPKEKLTDLLKEVSFCQTHNKKEVLIKWKSHMNDVMKTEIYKKRTFFWLGKALKELNYTKGKIFYLSVFEDCGNLRLIKTFSTKGYNVVINKDGTIRYKFSHGVWKDFELDVYDIPKIPKIPQITRTVRKLFE